MGITLECSWNEDHDLYIKETTIIRIFVNIHSKTIWRFFVINFVVYTIWDLVTLTLFVWKLRSLSINVSEKLASNPVFMKIRRNMHRIIVLAIMYEIPFLLYLVLYAVRGYLLDDVEQRLFWIAFVVTGTHRTFLVINSLSMFLMQQHNSKEYGTFLKWIVRLKLHFCCCCYRRSVVKQRNYFL